MSKLAEKAVNTFLGVSSNFTFYNATHRPQYASLVRAGPTFVELSSTDEQISHEMEQSCSNERVQVLVMVNLMQLPLDIYHTKKARLFVHTMRTHHRVRVRKSAVKYTNFFIAIARIES